MRYIINEKERIVIAILEDTEYDVVNFLAARGRFVPEHEYRINKCYKGIAKCHPGDEFDKAKGVELAKARAVLKHNEAFYRKVEKYYMYEKEEIDKLKKKSEKKLDLSIEKLKELTY